MKQSMTPSGVEHDDGIVWPVVPLWMKQSMTPSGVEHTIVPDLSRVPHDDEAINDALGR